MPATLDEFKARAVATDAELLGHLRHALRYQSYQGVHTRAASWCCPERSSRGGGTCVPCLKRLIAELAHDDLFRQHKPRLHDPQEAPDGN